MLKKIQQRKRHRYKKIAFAGFMTTQETWLTKFMSIDPNSESYYDIFQSTEATVRLKRFTTTHMKHWGLTKRMDKFRNVFCADERRQKQGNGRIYKLQAQCTVGADELFFII
ncbi:MAG: hypothetical protein L6V93_17810 [Clostridiales bacterium]|nr:MAG: hypothetical protein L6V93_17810 [Clostridiales bacterium]